MCTIVDVVAATEYTISASVRHADTLPNGLVKDLAIVYSITGSALAQGTSR